MREENMVLAGIKVADTPLVLDAVELARSSLEPYLFNHVMRSWLFGILLSEGAELVLDSELLAVSAVLHDLGLTDRHSAENRFEIDGANAARAFLKDRGISMQQTQVVWDAIALHTTPSIALYKEPEVAMTHSGIAIDVLGVGLDRIPQDKQRAVLAEFPRLAFKNQFQACLCNVVRRKPATSFDNILRDFGNRYVEGFTAPSFADLFENAPFSE
jgi:HD domain